MTPTTVVPPNFASPAPSCDKCGHPFTDRFPDVGPEGSSIHHHCALYYKQPFVDRRGAIQQDHGR